MTDTATITEKTPKRLVDEKLLTGKWEVSVEVKNSQGIKAFGGRHLTDYKHPLTGKTCALINLDNQRMIGYMLEKKSQILRPDEDAFEKRILEWLLAHPEVKIIGMKLDDVLAAKKIKNATVSLRNLERLQLDAIDAVDQKDKIIGRLSLDSGPQAIGLERMRYLLSALNLTYFEKRYIETPSTEKKYLRNRLKTYASAKNSDGVYNSVTLEKMLDEIDSYQVNYYVKEMHRKHVITISNSTYKYNNVPLGTTFESVIRFFRENEVVYLEAQNKLLPLLKEEGFK